MKERKSVTKEMAIQYRQASKGEKGAILDSFVGLTGYHRKYAGTVLKMAADTCRPRSTGVLSFARLGAKSV
jgi:hypothetical protein